ncbi:MAG TPA: AAA family ATPase [Steroidobacteraceae bacterium]|nr:AAA family ATPase [Steroidobacteraceae bacterium]
MLVRRLTVENVRSFLDSATLHMDGQISILIGPNGGGKTNLLDILVIALRRYLFASHYPAHAPTPEQPERYEMRHNDVLNNMNFERHSRSEPTRTQLVEIELEITQLDITSMHAMKNDANRLTEFGAKKYINLVLQEATQWNLDEFRAGCRVVYRVINGTLDAITDEVARVFLRYLQLFEIDSKLREEAELSALATPMMYLSVTRSSSGFQSSVQLANYNDFEQKRQSDGTSSRSGSSVVALAVGRMAQKFRLLLEKDKGVAAKEFAADKSLSQMTQLLRELGYEWALDCLSPLKNQYDVLLKKQGSTFLVGAASSGERELLTYLFAIFALNVRDAIIIVDEPELHLHPKWQQTLLKLFVRLAKSTGNQFLLATHSPTFVSPQSIQYVSRVFSKGQSSQILRLNASALPEVKHLFNIVNSQNNEKIFFADRVVLVEGLLDRIFFEAVLDHHGRSDSSRTITEIVSVGGKGFFAAYEKILKACQIGYAIVADLDYLEEIGSGDIKALFGLDAREVKKDVLENEGSLDGAALVARIDEAMASGNWADARMTWEYIKSRRRRLRPNLKATELAVLDAFIVNRAKGGIFLYTAS